MLEVGGGGNTCLPYIVKSPNSILRVAKQIDKQTLSPYAHLSEQPLATVISGKDIPKARSLTDSATGHHGSVKPGRGHMTGLSPSPLQSLRRTKILVLSQAPLGWAGDCAPGTPEHPSLGLSLPRREPLQGHFSLGTHVSPWDGALIKVLTREREEAMAVL